MGMQPFNLRRVLTLSAVTLSIGLTACSDEDIVITNDVTGSNVAIATRAADYTSGRMDLHDVATGNLSLSYPATGSDIRAASDGSNIYQIARFQMDNITKFETGSATVAYQYSVNGTDAAANPYQLIFASENKAYLLRYGSDKIWIINPNADSEAGFKLGELDISAYDTDAPNANSAVIIGSKLFVLMERLEGFNVTKQGYVAVFDTTTETEIDTGQGTADGLMGIALGVQNPESLQYNRSNGLLYLTGRGNIFKADATAAGGDRFTGGLVTIDPTSYVPTLLLDDGTEDNNQGFFKSAIAFNADTGYVLSYTGGFSGTNTLRRFNATTGTLADGAIAGLEAADITVIAEAPGNQLWVAVNAATPVVNRIDISTDMSVGTFNTELVPLNFAFVE